VVQVIDYFWQRLYALRQPAVLRPVRVRLPHLVLHLLYAGAWGQFDLFGAPYLVTRRGPAIVGGLINGSGNLGAAIGTITFPWMVSRIGYQSALQWTGAAGLVSGLVWFLIARITRSNRAQPRDPVNESDVRHGAIVCTENRGQNAK